jgi:2-polyprenyl-3-methyl-5-hydroxy-6-metoxy-1,4-benzoquinol methylase
MYEEEEKLLDHYNKHVNYSSTAGGHALRALDISLTDGGCLLDLGCGDGRLTTALPKNEYIYYRGVDFCPARIEKAKEKYPDRQFICQDVYEFLEGDEDKYDFIACFEVLEHLVEPQRVLTLARKRLKEGGMIFGSVPVDMGYIAHLQVFKNEEELKEKLNPDSWVEKNKHFWCKWS